MSSVPTSTVSVTDTATWNGTHGPATKSYIRLNAVDIATVVIYFVFVMAVGFFVRLFYGFSKSLDNVLTLYIYIIYMNKTSTTGCYLYFCSMQR